MLFIHDDEAETLQRREDRRAGADGDLRFAARQAAPFVEAFAAGQAAVQHGEAGGETGREALHELPGQGDFGHQNERRLVLAQRRGNGAHVDLGLAAAGNAVQEDWRPVRRRQLGLGLFQGVPLGVIQNGLRRWLVGRRWNDLAQGLDLVCLYDPLLLQALDRGRGARHLPAQRLQLARRLLQQKSQNLRLIRSAVPHLLHESPGGVSPDKQAHPRCRAFPHLGGAALSGLGDESLILQTPQQAREVAGADGFGEVLTARGALAFQAVKHLPCPARRPRCRRLPGLGRQVVNGGRALAEALGNGGLENLAPRAQVIVGNPFRQPQQVGRDHRRLVQDFAQCFEIGYGAVGGKLDDVAEDFAVADGDHHPLADGTMPLQGRRDAVVERFVEGKFDDDLGDAGVWGKGRGIRDRGLSELGVACHQGGSIACPCVGSRGGYDTS